MNEKVLHTLEYDKIVRILAEHAGSQSGAQMCLRLLPMTDLEAIRTAQTQTTDAVTRLRKKSGPSFAQLKDIRPCVMRLEIGSILSCEDLLSISSTLDTAESVRKFLRPENEEDPEDSLSVFYSSVDPCELLNSEIRRCILGIDEIADDASPKLKDIRRKQNQTKLQIQRTLNQMVTSTSMKTYLQDSVVTMRNGRYCIPVKQEHRAHVPGMVHDQSGSGSTIFVEPMAVVKLNNDLKELSLAEAEEIQVILSHLSNMAGGRSEALKLDFRLLTELDFILAKARYSESIRGNAPVFHEEKRIELKKARHPLIPVKTAVPIDLELGREFSMLIVTGPNTGGKTVSLKTTGLLCLMGQAGMHIPALDGSGLCVFEEIYADIGDEQSIEQNLSTFSSHMKNIIRILERADADSLVLLDELCSGTDPTEGAALAQSILTRLNQFGSRCMATTHYAELKVFAMSTKGVQNACCEFDVQTLRPTYRLLIGLPGKSNAFAISQKLGLDERLIEDAKERLDSSNIAFEDILADIEVNKKKARIEREEALNDLTQARKMQEDLEKEKAALEKKKNEILREAKSEAAQVLKQAKDYADLTIRDIRKVSGNVNLAALERTRTELGRQVKEALDGIGDLPGGKKTVKKKPAPEEITAGTPVRVLSMNMEGVATSGPDGKQRVGVRLGSMNMEVRLDDLEILEKSSEQEQMPKFARGARTGAGQIQFSKAMGVSTEIKLLGMNVDDALIELDKYLDDACMAHLEKVRIVHGKGTGVLRNAVRQKLHRDKRVRKSYEAEYGDGDSGVTYAELK
ncbi:MAG: endonuclease MutS2 [Parasporobacterium sp.]|nr:endonuclease MutS2 [Parasporobacterium sp.]